MRLSRITLILILIFSFVIAESAPIYTTYRAKIIRRDNIPLEKTMVNFKFTVMNPDKSCTLYTETYSMINMQGSSGLVSFNLGTGTKGYPTDSTKYIDVLKNGVTLNCFQGGTYTGATTDSRIVIMQFNDAETTRWQTTQALTINSVPYANYSTFAETAATATNATTADTATNATNATTAANALLLGGYSSSSFVQVSSLPTTCTAGQVLAYISGSFSCVSSSGGGTGDFSNGGNAYAASATIGTTDAHALLLTTNNSTRMTITSQGAVGIGTTTPSSTSGLNIVKEWSSNGVNSQVMSLFDSYGDIARVTLRRADGTSSVPIALTANKVIGSLSFSGFNGTDYSAQSVANISAITAENYTSSSMGSYLTINTNAIGAISSNERMRITSSGTVWVGATSESTDSAMLVASSTTRGFLMPRMTTTQRNAIATPATGLQVYNTTTNSIDYYNGTAWVSQVTSSGSSGGFINGGNSFGADATIGLNDGYDLKVSTNGVERMRVTSGGLLRLGSNSSSFADDGSLTKIYALNSATSYIVNIGVSSTSSDRGIFSAGKARGTESAPTAVLKDDWLGSYRFQGYMGSGMSSGTVVITAYAAEDFSVGKYGSYLKIQTTPIGSNNQTERFRITSSGTVWVGTTAGDDSALLDVTSTTRGFLMPRMTTAQRNAIATPATGLQVYNTSTNSIDYYNGSSWLSASTTTGDGSSITNITRANLAAGSADHVLINNSSGVMSSEAQLAVSRGGTGLSSFTVNSLLMANGTGSALTAGVCATTGEVYQWNSVSNAWGCTNLNTNYFAQGGNTFGVSATIGTLDAQSILLTTNSTTKMTITSQGAVGIGTTAPTATLHVATTAATSAVVIGDVPNYGGNYSATNRNAFARVGKNATDVITNAINKPYAVLELNPLLTQNTAASNSNGYIVGIESEIAVSGTANLHDIYGIDSSPRYYGQGTLQNIMSINAAPVMENAGAVTYVNSYTAWAKLTNTNATNYFGYYAASPDLYGTSVLTNSYGLYLEDIDSGTNRYAILTSQSTGYTMYNSGVASSYFAGAIGIGTTTPTQKLELSENINSGSSVKVRNLNSGTSAWAGLTLANDLGNTGFIWSPSSGWTNSNLQNRVVIQSNILNSSGLGFIAQKANTDMRFYFGGITDADEKIRINQNGYLGISNTNPSYLLHVGSSSVGTGSAVAQFQNVDGTCTLTPGPAGGLACSSDERLKENFQYVNGALALEKILKLQAYSYNFKTAPIENKQVGFKAQEVQKLFPEIVRSDDRGFLQVYYDAVIPWITSALREIYQTLNQSIEEQKNIKRKIAHFEDDQSNKNELIALQLIEKKQEIKLLESKLKIQEQIVEELKVELCNVKNNYKFCKREK